MLTEKRTDQQIRTVERLLSDYKQEKEYVPLARFLAAFYKRNRQMGSKDRRAATRLVYHYFRIGRAAAELSFPERLALGEFLCTEESAVVRYVLPAFYPLISAPLEEKVRVLKDQTPFRLEDVFPYGHHLSAEIDRTAFIKSLFTQPELFLRIRPAHMEDVVTAFAEAGVAYSQVDRFTLALPNGTALERIDGINGKYEVQDYASQQTEHFFRASAGESWWDACAGAGGKSLLLIDNCPGIKLLVSDVRTSILRNLDVRFEAAGIQSYRKKIIDLAKGNTGILADEQFDGIIVDAPCSGSGTWGRTPEMISAFDERSISQFQTLQKRIAGTAVKHLKTGKPLIYITCSVFAAENEGVVAQLQTQHGLKVESMRLIRGYEQKADSMFVARLIRQ